MLLRVVRPDSKWRSTCQLLGFLKGENRVGLALWAPWPGCSLAYCSPSSVAMGPTTSFFGANVAMAVAPHIFDWANAGNTSYIETSLNWELFCDTHQAFTIFLSKLSKLSWSVFTKMSIFKTSSLNNNSIVRQKLQNANVWLSKHYIFGGCRLGWDDLDQGAGLTNDTLGDPEWTYRI